jgi:uncharacterized protein
MSKLLTRMQFVGAAIGGLSTIVSPPLAAAQTASPSARTTAMQLTQDWDKTFPKSDKVDHKKVTFKNRYGIILAADLYQPKNASGRLAAIAISGPFGAVKEQASGLYAQTMAERGFITLALDPSYTGESSGETRNMASPDVNTEDFSAAVDFLGLQPNVDGYTMEQRHKVIDYISQQRWIDAESGKYALGYHEVPFDEQGNIVKGQRVLPESLPANPDPVLVAFFNYYKTSRGFHPRGINSTTAWTATTPMSFFSFPMYANIEMISPRPVLLVAGENAHSRYYSEDVYKVASDPKELVIVPNADHVDLYDQMDKIPFDKLTSFFKQHLS